MNATCFREVFNYAVDGSDTIAFIFLIETFHLCTFTLLKTTSFISEHIPEIDILWIIAVYFVTVIYSSRNSGYFLFAVAASLLYRLN